VYCTAVVRPTGGFRALRCRGGRREKRSSLSSPPPYTWVSPAPRVRVKRHGGTLEAGVAAPAAELEGAEAVVVTWKGSAGVRKRKMRWGAGKQYEALLGRGKLPQ
jgi:hypothetical protein